MSDDIRPEDIRLAVREFISDRFPKLEFTDSEDIFSLGFVNSLFAMELVMFLEKNGAGRIPNTELRLDNFRSVDAMSDLVSRLSGAEAPVR